ncbi:low molecular weight protein-tyrosine-phosphatase [Metabacillus malikii]|uniref:protein-tyrosine-phosphatase n=1 Tax=Metabacillus malikii TaxID=1504265 RepID=A0ABT9ZIJ9_9BACI|nr:low molecular weight protein-tyrosine-phosphatase [Metabacillus malikii]MDQ0231651.1 protein-tyrosine phosphatase [Metabacillus malikii]
MVKVLFVCLGNICRSPMAEAVMRHLIAEEGLEDKITVDSAGTGDWHIGKPPHQGTREILTKNQISYEGQTARQLLEQDISSFDYIIGMDAENIGNIKRLAGDFPTNHIKRLLDYAKEFSTSDVPDPYYTGNFDEVYEMVTEGCRNLLSEIKHEYQL